MDREIKLLFATNRNCLSNSNGLSFGHDVTNSIHFGYVDSNRVRHSLDAPSFFGRIQATLNVGGDILNFIHGYNADFDEALRRGEEIVRLYGDDVVDHKRDVVVLSWPSIGALKQYEQDFKNAQASGILATVLESQLSLPSAENAIHLSSQSFGNVALKAIALRLNASRAKLAEVIMTAPTLPESAFSDANQLARLPSMAKRITVYFNRSDFGQIFQPLLNANVKMAQRGPIRRGLPENVVVVSVAKVAPLRHSYYLRSNKVIADINAALKGEPAGSPVLNRRYIPRKKHFKLI